MKLPLPKQPEMFFKPASCLHSPLEAIVLPVNATDAIDAEVELAVIIKADCKNVRATDAMNYVLGYTLANDLTARDVQGKISQWAYAKCFDSFCPVGPVLVSLKAMTDPHNLRVSTTINGKTLQDGTTKNLIFSIPEIIEYLSAVGLILL